MAVYFFEVLLYFIWVGLVGWGIVNVKDCLFLLSMICVLSCCRVGNREPCSRDMFLAKVCVFLCVSVMHWCIRCNLFYSEDLVLNGL